MFIVTGQNVCCGCSAPVYVGWAYTREEAEAIADEYRRYSWQQPATEIIDVPLEKMAF